MNAAPSQTTQTFPAAFQCLALEEVFPKVGLEWRPNASSSSERFCPSLLAVTFVLIIRHTESRSRRYGRSSVFSRTQKSHLWQNRSEPTRSRASYISNAICLLLLTGCRKNELLTLQWVHVDLDRAHAFLPDSKTGRKPVYLNAPAFKIMSRLPRVEGNPYVIVGERSGSHLVNIDKAWHEIRAAAGMPSLRLHDLRHSYASVGAAGGSLCQSSALSSVTRRSARRRVMPTFHRIPSVQPTSTSAHALPQRCDETERRARVRNARRSDAQCLEPTGDCRRHKLHAQWVDIGCNARTTLLS